MEASSHFEADPLTREIIAAAIEVHKNIGPGLIDSIYEEALCYELELRRMPLFIWMRAEAAGVALSIILLAVGGML